MGTVVGLTTRTASKAHSCWLCSLPIDPGSRYLSWAWIDVGVSAMSVKAHPACDAYAQENLFEWTSGDGLEDGSVETDLEEALLCRFSRSTGVPRVDQDARARILADFPDLAPLVAKVCRAIEEEL